MLRIHDSRDVHSLHGLPGLVAAVGGIIAAALATEEVYGTRSDLNNLWILSLGTTTVARIYL